MGVKKKSLILIAASFLLVACSNVSSGSTDDNDAAPVVGNVTPAFLKPGDKVALLSPSYSTPDSNIQKTAEAIRAWGFVPEIGKNVGKLDAGKYAGTVQERADDFIAALKDTSIKAILCNRGAYYGKKVLVK